MTSRRNTIQKDLVRNTVYEMRRHVTANEVYEFIKEAYPTIGKGTVYRNLDILVEEGALRKVEVPNGPNRFDFTLKNHYHVRCIKCGEIFDVDMDQIPDLLFLTGRCRKGRAYQDAGKRQALCQISMIFDLSQIKSTKTTNRRNNHGRKKIHILRQISEGEIR